MKVAQVPQSTQQGWIQDFPWGGQDPFGGRGPPTWALFGENVCENERIGSRRGRAPENFVCRSAIAQGDKNFSSYKVPRLGEFPAFDHAVNHV